MTFTLNYAHLLSLGFYEAEIVLYFYHYVLQIQHIKANLDLVRCRKATLSGSNQKWPTYNSLNYPKIMKKNDSIPRPQMGRVKLNTDGSIIGNPGLAWCWGIFLYT